MMKIEKQIARAFKKLKADIYYDKIQSILCQQLVEYESKAGNRLEERFKEIGRLLITASEKEWLEYQSKI